LQYVDLLLAHSPFHHKHFTASEDKYVSAVQCPNSVGQMNSGKEYNISSLHAFTFLSLKLKCYK